VINMGVPVLIGVCQQSASGGYTSTFSIRQLGTVSVSWGNDITDQTPIDPSERVSTDLNDDNSFTYPTGGLRSFYDSENAGIPVQYTFTPIINATGIDTTELPADGDCEVIYEFKFDPTRFPIKVWDLEFGTLANSGNTPVTMTFDGLDRSVFTTSGAVLPSLINDNDLSIIAPEPGSFASPSISLTIKIKMGDGTYIEQEQAIITVSDSIDAYIV